MMIHPTFSSLLAYSENALPPETAAEIEAHLAAPCAHCQTDLARVRAVLDALVRQNKTVAPPATIVRRAIAAFQPRPSPAQQLRTIADLIFDSFRQAPLAAVRGAAQSRQMLFTAEGLDIDLHITAEPDNVTLMGQVLGARTFDAQSSPFVRLYHAGDVLDAARADALGQFAFRAVPAGLYDLGVEVEAREIIIEGLELGDG
jgi:hypothetical protein